MSRGGISFEGIGAKFATFAAGAGIKALVNAVGANRDSVVGLAVEITGAGTVDLGVDGDTLFGFIDSYETDGYCTVQYAGFRTDAKPNATAPTVGKIAALDGAGKVKDSATTAKLRNPVTVEVDATAGTTTVFLG